MKINEDYAQSDRNQRSDGFYYPTPPLFIYLRQEHKGTELYNLQMTVLYELSKTQYLQGKSSINLKSFLRLK